MKTSKGYRMHNSEFRCILNFAFDNLFSHGVHKICFYIHVLKQMGQALPPPAGSQDKTFYFILTLMIG